MNPTKYVEKPGGTGWALAIVGTKGVMKCATRHVANKSGIRPLTNDSAS
jgi:hypothetical protein